MCSHTATIKLADDVERKGAITADAVGSRVFLDFFRTTRTLPYATITLGPEDALALSVDMAGVVADLTPDDDGGDE